MSAVRIVELTILGLCILSSGFLSGSETALMAVPRERVHQLAAAAGRRGQRLEELVDDPERTLSTLLVANNFVNILGASVAATLAIGLVGETWGPWVSTLAVTAVILVFGEITPKTLAARHPDQFSMVVAPTISRLGTILQPISRVFVAISRVLLRLMGSGRGTVRHVTEEDVRALAILGEAAGQIDPAELEILESLFSLEERPVRDVMTPRIDLVVLQTPLTVDQVRRAVASHGHSRYLVVDEDGDLDQPLGILHAKDLLRSQHPMGSEHLERLLREPRFLPESASLLSALHQMRMWRAGLAVVLDEHGGIEGVVTVKDLIAELVGELQDEYDPGVPTAVPVEDGTWIADGRLTVEDLAEAIDRPLPEGPYTTAGGLFLSVAGAIPHEGDRVLVDDVELVVERMDRRRVDQLRVQVH